MTCPYCKQRNITMTLCVPEGTYSVCRVCAVQWGLRAKAVEAGEEIRLLEWMWSQPDAEVQR